MVENDYSTSLTTNGIPRSLARSMTVRVHLLVGLGNARMCVAASKRLSVSDVGASPRPESCRPWRGLFHCSENTTKGIAWLFAHLSAR